MKSVILFREDQTCKDEADVARKYFPVYSQRIDCKDSLVIGRYSVLPYYKELENDLIKLNSRLIHDYNYHKWIANFEYYELLKEHTFESWNDDNFYQCDYPGPFVVKGKTNSRKFRWDTSMFAKTKKDALNIANDLAADGLIGEQGIIYRKYYHLETYEVGLHGLPFSNEWRFYFYGRKMLDYGYYWSIAEKTNYIIGESGINFAQMIADLIFDEKGAGFVGIDIAKRENQEWILVELNDGQMAGLSENNPDLIYKNLKQELESA